jgi:hypothetical protein
LTSYSADQLFHFLVHTHPPQRPGALAQDEYWALAAFLFSENDRLPTDGYIGPKSAHGSTPGIATLGAITLGALLVAIFIYSRKQRSGGSVTQSE